MTARSQQSLGAATEVMTANSMDDHMTTGEDRQTNPADQGIV